MPLVLWEIFYRKQRFSPNHGFSKLKYPDLVLMWKVIYMRMIKLDTIILSRNCRGDILSVRNLIVYGIQMRKLCNMLFINNMKYWEEFTKHERILYYLWFSLITYLYYVILINSLLDCCNYSNVKLCLWNFNPQSWLKFV